MAVQAKKLFFLHVGNQKPGQFDNDLPMLVGMDGIKEMVAMLWLLDRMGWQGHAEFDNHILRADTAPGKENSTRIRMDFIRQNIENYRMAEKKAHDLAADPDLNKMMASAVGPGARYRQDPFARGSGRAPEVQCGLRQGERHRHADRAARPDGEPQADGNVAGTDRAYCRMSRILAIPGALLCGAALGRVPALRRLS